VKLDNIFENRIFYMINIKKINYYLIFFVPCILLLSLILCANFIPSSVISAEAQDIFSDEEISAYTITRFEGGFAEYEVQIMWSVFEEADEYRIYKSTNEGEFEEVNEDYEDEGFQLWWTDSDILEGNSYSYYIEGYSQGEYIRSTKQVDVDFWLPACPAKFPIDNEVVHEEQPTFEWEPISITTFPFKNVIYSARGKFLLHDLTEDKEIWKTEIPDINTGQIVFDIDDAGKELEKKHQYQWQYKVTGYNNENQPIAESITGSFFSFQEKTEKVDELEEEYPEGSLNIDAESLSYQIIDGEDVIVARDKVNLRYQDIVLEANFVQIIIDKNELIAKEQVIFTKGKESYSCQALNYNWESEKIIMDELSGEATGDKIKGKVYYQGKRMENFPETIEITNSYFTTCDLEKPHWHIEAEEITIYPDDKIIAKKISWYEGDKKIFTLPSFMIFLRGKNQLPYLPDIGQSSNEGWYFKNQFNYVEDATSYGSVYLNLMEKKGIGTGIEHTFELGEEKVDDGELVLYLYGLKRKNNNIVDLDGRISYWENFENNLKLKANVVYDGSIYSSSDNSSHNIKPDFYLYKKWEDALLTLTGKYNFNIDYDSVSSTGNIKLSYDYALTDRLKSNLDLLYTSKDTGIDESADLELRPEWLLRYNGNGYTLSLVTEKQIDLDGDSFTGDGNSRSLDKLPELIFKKSSSKIKNTDINYSINASIARYYEGAIDEENIRGEYIINVNRPFTINDHISFTTSGVYRQDVYLTGEARYLVGGKLDLKVGYKPEFYGNFSYNYYISEGPTPFNFDVLSPLTESASASIVLKPREDLQINLSTNYNFVSESFGSLSSRIKWKPKDEHDIYLSTYYDLNNMEWNKRIDTRMSLKLSEKWKLSYRGSIYFDDFDIRNSIISVVRDLHCREISINYKQSNQSIWVDFKINAFPTESITIGG